MWNHAKIQRNSQFHCFQYLDNYCYLSLSAAPSSNPQPLGGCTDYSHFLHFLEQNAYFKNYLLTVIHYVILSISQKQPHTVIYMSDMIPDDRTMNNEHDPYSWHFNPELELETVPSNKWQIIK